MLFRLCVLAIYARLVKSQNGFVPFIIEGENSPEGLYTFMVAIKRFDDYKCGGSLITPRHVLTAKHCTALLDLTKYEIVLGEYDRGVTSGHEQYFGVDRIIKHHDEDTDASIIVLDGNAMMNEHVSLVRLAPTPPPLGSKVTAMGWGYIRSGSSAQAQVLQRVDILIADHSRCEDEGFAMRDHEVCGGDSSQPQYTNICSGDSGSPVIFPSNASEMNQVALAARGHAGCPAERRFAAFVSVPAIFDWAVCSTNRLEGTNVTEVQQVDCSGMVSTTPRSPNTQHIGNFPSTMPAASENTESAKTSTRLTSTVGIGGEQFRTATKSSTMREWSMTSSELLTKIEGTVSDMTIRTTTEKTPKESCDLACLIVLATILGIMVITSGMFLICKCKAKCDSISLTIPTHNDGKKTRFLRTGKVSPKSVKTNKNTSHENSNTDFNSRRNTDREKLKCMSNTTNCDASYFQKINKSGEYTNRSKEKEHSGIQGQHSWVEKEKSTPTSGMLLGRNTNVSVKQSPAKTKANGEKNKKHSRKKLNDTYESKPFKNDKYDFNELNHKKFPLEKDKNESWPKTNMQGQKQILLQKRSRSIGTLSELSPISKDISGILSVSKKNQRGNMVSHEDETERQKMNSISRHTIRDEKFMIWDNKSDKVRQRMKEVEEIIFLNEESLDNALQNNNSEPLIHLPKVNNFVGKL